MDQELFELCKDVYERTRWGRMDNNTSTDQYYEAYWTHLEHGKPDVVRKWRITNWGEFQEVARLHMALDHGKAVPYYTSDYLLDKLPTGYTCGVTRMGHQMRVYTAFHYNTSVHADTQLKALLKLTIALHEAGWFK